MLAAPHQKPAAHLPEHSSVGRPAVAPNVPGGHALAVGDVDAGGQKWPTAQRAVQDAEERPRVAPYVPAGQFAG